MLLGVVLVTVALLPTLINLIKRALYRIGKWLGLTNTVTIEGKKYVIEDRTVFVLLQEESPLSVNLRVGGEMCADTWKNVDVVKYETHPQGAVNRASAQYPNYKVAAIREVDEDAELTTFMLSSAYWMNKSGWVTVDPERDFPDE